jgi:hypothetical protein
MSCHTVCTLHPRHIHLQRTIPPSQQQSYAALAHWIQPVVRTHKPIRTLQLSSGSVIYIPHSYSLKQ